MGPCPACPCPAYPSRFDPSSSCSSSTCTPSGHASRPRPSIGRTPAISQGDYTTTCNDCNDFIAFGGPSLVQGTLPQPDSALVYWPAYGRPRNANRREDPTRRHHHGLSQRLGDTPARGPNS